MVEDVSFPLIFVGLLLKPVQLHYQAVKYQRKAREGSVAKVEKLRLQAEVARLEKSHEELRTYYERAWAQELEVRDARIEAAKSTYESIVARIAAENEASEKQLADHVLQNEAELERLREERNTWVRILSKPEYSVLTVLCQNEQMSTLREQSKNALVRLLAPGCPTPC